MKMQVGHLCAWLTLVVLPAFVAVSSTVSVIALRASTTDREGRVTVVPKTQQVSQLGLQAERQQVLTRPVSTDPQHPGYGA